MTYYMLTKPKHLKIQLQIDNKREEDAMGKIQMSYVKDPLSTLLKTKHTLYSLAIILTFISEFYVAILRQPSDMDCWQCCCLWHIFPQSNVRKSKARCFIVCEYSYSLCYKSSKERCFNKKRKTGINFASLQRDHSNSYCLIMQAPYK